MAKKKVNDEGTINDGDTVPDLDSEKGAELNPSFTFDLGGDFRGSADAGWNFDVAGAKSSRKDKLDDILKRHGGLTGERRGLKIDSEDEEEDDDNSEGDEGSEGSDDDEADNDEPASAENDSGTDDEDEGDEDEDEAEEDEDDEDTEGEKEEASEPEQGAAEDVVPKIADDKSGFFEDAAIDTTRTSFVDLPLSRPIKKGIANLGYTKPTPIQSSVIPVALLGKDVVAGAVTGSGKTAAYMVPTLERLLYRSQKTPTTRVVVLTPTRELAIQVCDVGKKLGSFVTNLRFGLAVGGLNLRAQELELKTRPDIVVATPGRFIDHVRNSPSFSVEGVEVLILDEADRMLEEGFESELNEILSLIPTKRQTMLFSATMNSSIKDLVKLSLHKPVRLMINPPKQAATGLSQEFVRLRKHEDSRPAVLVSLLQKISAKERVIVFVSRKQTAHKLRIIVGLLGIQVAELHGALTQEQRVESINAFKSLQVPVLICTDLASRGLDIPKIEVVINYELPSTYEVYLHRVGRTARAGRSGTSISLVGDTTTERSIVRSAVNAASSQEKTTARKQTILGRKIDWQEVDSIKQDIKDREGTIEDVLQEEKASKELDLAERDMLRAQNLLQHKDEIQSRPKRTWFEANSAKGNGKGNGQSRRAEAKKNMSNRKKKRAEAATQQFSYNKTKADRDIGQKRGANRVIMKNGAKAARAKFK